MKAEDTVMENLAPAIIAHPDLPMGQAIAIEQAELSFKAGLEKGAAMVNAANAENLKQMRRAGQRDVVDWFKDNPVVCVSAKEAKEFLNKWEAQLKKWGIDER